VALAVIAGGCGEEGAAEGAELTVYVSAPLQGAEAQQGKRLCDEAREQVAQAREGDYELRVVCLNASGQDGSWTLAKVGSNARRATEDSTTVAYLGEPDRAARRQSQPIVEAAEIAALGGIGGREAISTVTAALRDSDSDDPRRAVFDAVEG
jgi:branched-chain amino acid transport system substrate-binding protein